MLADMRDGQIKRAELIRVNQDLIFAHKPADRGDFGHTFDTRQLQF